MDVPRPGMRRRWVRGPYGRAALPRAPGRVAWVLPCPNLSCDTELVILPEQAGEWVECPRCGFRFVAPRQVAQEGAAADEAAPGGPVPAQIAEGPAAREADALERAASPPEVRAARAADALDALTRGAPAAGPAGAPGAARLPRPGTHPPLPRRAHGERRVYARAPLAERADAARRPRVPADLALTWAVALLAAGAVAAAAMVLETPDFVLAAGVFVGLAALRTALVLRRGRP